MVGIPYKLPTFASLGRLWLVINTARPYNGFTRSGLAKHGWVSQPRDASLLLIFQEEENN